MGTDPDAGDVTPANPDSLGGTYAVDLAKTFAVTFAGGQADAVPQPPQNTIAYAHGFDFGLLFDVPDSFAGGTLAIRPNGTLFAGPAGFQPGRPADARPVTWQKPLAAKQVPLTVSG